MTLFPNICRSAILVAAGTMVGGLFTPAQGQDAILDQGRYEIYQDGTKIGTETVLLRRSGGEGQRVWAIEGHTELLDPTRGRELSKGEIEVPEAPADPIQYRLQSHRLEGKILVTRQRQAKRVVVKAEGQTGLQQREHIAPGNLVIMDETSVYPHYPLVLRGDISTDAVPAFVITESSLGSLRLRDLGWEQVEAMDSTVRAKHRRITPEGEGLVRHLWVTEDGLIARMEVPARNYTYIHTGR